MTRAEKRYQWACLTSSDIQAHLPKLRELGEQCTSIAEFGVRGAMSTSAWLAARPQRLFCYDILIPACIEELNEMANEQGTVFRFTQGDSRKAFIEPVDLLFLDTIHTADYLAAEVGNNHRNVAKYLVFHDTVLFGQHGEEGGDGLNRFIYNFLLGHPEWVMDYFDTRDNGLTVLKR